MYFETYFEDLVTCFNDFSRPEFCKIQEYHKKKYEMEIKELEAARKVNLVYQRGNKQEKKNQLTSYPELQNAIKQGKFNMRNLNTIMPKMLNFDRMLYNREIFEASYSYERYMGRIKLKEMPNNIV